MGKLLNLTTSILIIAGAAGILFYLFWPSAEKYINVGYPIGDDAMHLANIVLFQRHHAFPVKAWQGQWFAGYPLLEGYPWVHYYLVQPLVSYLGDAVTAMNYYSAVSLFLYILTSFFLLLYASKNKPLAILLSIILLYGADSTMALYVNGYIVFVASQFLLPLALLLVLAAREKENPKLLVLAAFVFSFSFYAHASMTGIIVLPAILPYLIFDKKGKITKRSLIWASRFFVLSSLLSGIQIYQYTDLALRGLSVSNVVLHPLSEIPSRFASMFSWQNPVLIILFIAPLFTIGFKRSFSYLKPYLFSLISVFIVFSLMVFNITGLAIILQTERALWAITLAFLVFCAATVRQLVVGSRRDLLLNIISIGATAFYLYAVLVVKSPLLLPKTAEKKYPRTYLAVGSSETDRATNKYDVIFSYPPLSWNQSFDNYRCDGISYTIYAWWNLVSPNQRYKGWYPAMKGLPLDWSGLVTASELGRLGEGGALDDSQVAKNQALFFLDWYGIRHLQVAETDKDLASYLKAPPIITGTEKSRNLVYYSIDPELVSPLYAPTDAKTLAVVAPEKQYDNFIRTLSYTKYSSQKLIPLYLGKSLDSLKKKGTENYDAIFIYGYSNPLLSSRVWRLLAQYVKEGGNLIVETGQKVKETEVASLPEVFPVSTTLMEAIDKPWNVGMKEGVLTQAINRQDFTPLGYKYLPFAISKAPVDSLRPWAKPDLLKGDDLVLAHGELGQGKVVWSGLNLPFQAVDTRNISETQIFGNILDWFFPEIPSASAGFEVSYPRPEEIIVSGSKAKGVLLKEHFNPGWQAKVDGKKAKIYKAGLFLMYVPLDNSQADFILKLTYNGSPVNWVLFAISTISLVASVSYLIWGGKIFQPVIKFVSKKSKKIKGFVILEEE